MSDLCHRINAVALWIFQLKSLRILKTPRHVPEVCEHNTKQVAEARTFLFRCSSSFNTDSSFVKPEASPTKGKPSSNLRLQKRFQTSKKKTKGKHSNSSFQSTRPRRKILRSKIKLIIHDKAF